MEIIEWLSDKISDEIHDAHEYAEKALEVRGTYPDLAQVLYGISTEETDHMKRLHDAVEHVIADYREKTGEPPADTMAVYDYLHKKQIGAAGEAKALQAIYKGN